jgi:hypothetical protein
VLFNKQKESTAVVHRIQGITTMATNQESCANRKNRDKPFESTRNSRQEAATETLISRRSRMHIEASFATRWLGIKLDLKKIKNSALML